MSLRPPTVRITLALAGACLVLLGAKGVVLDVPVMREINLFDISRSASWTLVSATVGVLLLAWLRPTVFAWLAWCVALGALAYMLNDLWQKVQQLGAHYAESTAAGEATPDIQKILRNTEPKPGAVAIVSGLVLQAVALCLKRKAPAEAKS